MTIKVEAGISKGASNYITLKVTVRCNQLADTCIITFSHSINS